MESSKRPGRRPRLIFLALVTIGLVSSVHSVAWPALNRHNSLHSASKRQINGLPNSGGSTSMPTTNPAAGDPEPTLVPEPKLPEQLSSPGKTTPAATPHPDDSARKEPGSASPTLATRPSGPSVIATKGTPPGELPTNPPTIYLTFDDGPDKDSTAAILGLLQKHQAHATFFMVGSAIAENPSMPARVLNEGHAIGNHTAHHADLTKLTGSRLAAEIAGGVPTAECLRPPYGAGAHTSSVIKAAAAAGQKIQLWTVDPLDWQRPSAKILADRVLSKSHNGSVVLLHDGGGDRSATIAAVAIILPKLRAKGYRLEALPSC